jgi:hypothetical protein
MICDRERNLESITDEEWEDIEDECFYWIEWYLEENAIFMSDVSFFDTMVEHVYEYIYYTGKEQGWCDPSIEDDLFEWVEQACAETMYLMNIPQRQSSHYRMYLLEQQEIEQTLRWLNTFPVQKQRSAEWYAVRHNLFSASNLWKLFGSQSQYNSLLYEKCKDIEKVDILSSSSFGGDVLTPNPRNWGIKYEPVSIMVYEHKFRTKVNTNYGCIPHETLPIGASPDGINILPNHPKYGHMVEVKNIYNREMDGIPSTEYWTQIQIQLATCHLEYCDFLETRFKEYSSVNAFIEDDTTEYKGAILFFIPRDGTDGSSQYVYVPLHVTVEELDEWILQKENQLSDYILYQISYWYLDEFICSEVERNDWWFQSAIPTIQSSWNTVLQERANGFEHRAPQKRKQKIFATENSIWEVLQSSTIPNAVNLVKLDENNMPI